RKIRNCKGLEVPSPGFDIATSGLTYDFEGIRFVSIGQYDRHEGKAEFVVQTHSSHIQFSSNPS
ncbi:MAG: hypothetical protein Q8P64_11895, partial [Deltaproteobacteria bacterium]|nr:hypothetical protein [Deltaproteobacteria bacterium]